MGFHRLLQVEKYPHCACRDKQICAEVLAGKMLVAVIATCH